MSADSVLGRPLWYELMTTDMAAAEKFYKPVVGWTTTPFDGAGMPYSMWTRSDGVPVGGRDDVARRVEERTRSRRTG